MFEKVKEMIVQYVSVEGEITEDSRFIEDLGFDSFSVMSLVGDIEDEFDVEVDEHDVAEVRTIKDMMNYIEKLQNK